jgi:hypothetical protein
MHIDSYSFGSMTVDGKTYRSDIIIFPDHIDPNWWRAEGHSLRMEDLKEVLEYKPEILVVGRGASGCMDIPVITREKLEAMGMKIIDGNTGDVYEIFNENIKKEKKVIGAFHLTC